VPFVKSGTKNLISIIASSRIPQALYIGYEKLGGYYINHKLNGALDY
jgi:hypothetical protein